MEDNKFKDCEAIRKKAESKAPNTVVAQNPDAPWAYSEIVKEHFLNPCNFLMGDETKFSHNAEGVVGNPVCGDQMKMFLQIEDDKIVDIKWKTYGCASAIASTSALSELAKGKTLKEALKIDAEEITEYLGGLPKQKFHCSVLGHEALAAAIKAYRIEQNNKPKAKKPKAKNS